MINHRFTRLVVAFAFGLALSLYSYFRVTDPLPRQERQREEAVVMQAREILTQYVALQQPLEIVDPVNRNRKIGKVYIYPESDGWQVSGHYRRHGEIRWHPWLMTLDADHKLKSLDVQDATAQLADRAADDPRLTVKR